MRTTHALPLALLVGSLSVLTIHSARAFDVEMARQVGVDAVAARGSRGFRSDTEKATYVMGRLGDAVARARVRPNGSYLGRVRSGLTRGSLKDGNCQWCAEMLREALVSAGLSPKSMFLVFGQVRPGTLMDLNPLEVNKTHCALALVVNGQVIVFDLWKHGMVKGDFGGAANGRWKALPMQQWAVRLQHYDLFGFESPFAGSAYNQAVLPCQGDLLRAWRTINKHARPAPAQPAPKPTKPTGTAALRSGSYTVEAGGALLQWDIVVTSSGNITGTCNGSEALSGNIADTVLRVRRACPGFAPPYQGYVGTRLDTKFVGDFRGAGIDSGQKGSWILRLPR